MKKVVIAGANGFIGKYLSRHFAERGWEVVGLSRRRDGLDDTSRYVQWDGESLGEWARELDGADAVVNLSGKNLNCRHHTENKKLIIESRVNSTRVLGQAIATCQKAPRTWFNASGASIYANMATAAQTEDGEHADNFLADVVKVWEEELYKADVPDIVRRVALRTSVVMAKESDNVYGILKRLSSLGLGGQLGSGKQMVSWIHIQDYCQVLEWIIENEGVSGAVNLASPNPVTNSDMMARFRKHVNMPIGLPAASWMVQIGAKAIGTEASLILDPLWVSPGKLNQHGYKFRHSEMVLSNF